MPKAITLGEQLKDVPAAVRPTVRAARRLVRSVAPRAEEIAYRSTAPRASSSMIWKLARYAVDGENVVGIGTRPTYATLYFFRGRELDDDSGLLEGGGKAMRSIRLASPADLARPAVKRLVRRAFAQV